MSISLRPSQALQLWQQVTLSEVRDDAPDLTMRQMAILPPWLVLLLVSGLILGGWLREGRR